MKYIIPLLLVIFSLSFFNCHTKNAVHKDTIGTARPADTTAVTIKPPDDAAHQNAAGAQIIQANISRVIGTVKKVDLLDSLYYRITIAIDSSFAMGDQASLAERGQEVTVTPRFVEDVRGGVDTTNERNKRLLSLRSLSTASPFRGKISLLGQGKWIVVDIDTH